MAGQSAAMEKAIADVLSADRLMLTKFVLVVEVLRDDGERTLMVEASDELRTWDIAGLLAGASARIGGLMAGEWTDDDGAED